MLTDERLKQLMRQVGMPNSTSLYKALRQCDMEATLAERERCATLITSGNYCRYVDHNNGTCDCADMAAGLRAVLEGGEDSRRSRRGDKDGRHLSEESR